jgi:hypothetical protein
MIRIDGYPIDLALTEEHSFDSEVTEYPVENGADISDNIRNKPLEITLEGIVSDTPIGAIAQDATRQAGAGTPLPSRDAYTRIVAIRDARELVTIETSLGKFERMALTHIGVPRDRSTGKALKFTVTFRQVTLVTNERVTVRVAVPNATGKANGGNRQPMHGINGKPVPKAFESRPRWVTSWDARSRATLRQSLGEPILTTTRQQRLTTGGKKDPFTIDVIDHYPLQGDQQIADGYVQRAPDGKDYYFARTVGIDRFGRQYGVGGSSTQIEQRIDGHDVEWDDGSNEWKDTQTGKTVRKVPPGENRWKGVQFRRRPKDGEDPPWSTG